MLAMLSGQGGVLGMQAMRGSYVNQIYIRQSTECFSMRRDLTVKVFFKLSARLGQGVGCSDQLHARVLLKRGQHEGKGSA